MSVSIPMKQRITVALAGNPNSGKTTIFNALTGARQHVGNYSGVTVERKEGVRRHGDIEVKLIDLPGAYSLTAYSAEEVVARNCIIDEQPDIVVDIIDSSNLERNLYLAVQIAEMGAPLVLAFNMSDMAKARGYEFDLAKLSAILGAPIVPMVGHKGIGMQELLDTIVSRSVASGKSPKRPAIPYGREMETEIVQIASLLRSNTSIPNKYDTRWLAVKFLENDKDLRSVIHSAEILSRVEKSAVYLETVLGEHPENAIAGRRYEFISGICREAVRSTIEIRHTVSDRIDSIVTHRIFGLPIFLGLMYLVFQLTFTLGEPPMGWIEGFFGWLGGVVETWWPTGSESALKSLFVDGIISGVGGVVVFLPNILFLFLAIAILEDTGYMARAAFIMDRLMHKIGLHGKSFIPLLIGFGCSVPAIMATRTLENRRDRLVTMLVTPFMSCGARLPIYALIIPAFFPNTWHAPMLWIIYTIGIVLAILSAKLLRATLLKGESVPFVMELPPYHMITISGVLIHMWEGGWLYLKKVGTIILGISILLWAVTSYPKRPELEDYRQGETVHNQEVRRAEALAYTVAGRVGLVLEPALKQMGFDWRIGTALIGAFAAKEVFVAQMGIVYSVGETDEESDALRVKLRSHYSPLVAFCIMLFCLVSAPCMATIAVIRRESNSWKWALFQLGGLTTLAYALTVLVYQTGYYFGIGI
ncbi:MAG: ferrous iron transport protein B [Candidatus Latescibacterota bacterium]